MAGRWTAMIGYYAHHRGAGHLQRATAVAARLGSGVTVLSSAQPAKDVPYLALARDDDEPVHGDVTAAGALHWAPLRHSGFRKRSGQITDWITRADCNLLVSDVSVEVLLLARLLSTPSVAVALRGERRDRSHALGYDVASRIVVPWPRATHGDELRPWRDKLVWVGAVSRFDGRARDTGRCLRPGRCAVVLLGRGGDSMTARDLREAAAVPDTHWHLLGGCVPPGLPDRRSDPLTHSVSGGLGGDMSSVECLGWVADPWPVLCQADVVIAAAGDAAIADVAAAGRPLIAVPQARPFREQHAHAAALVGHGLCIAAVTWPDRNRWPKLLEQAERIGGDRWPEYCDGLGSARMADVLLEVAKGPAAEADGRTQMLSTSG